MSLLRKLLLVTAIVAAAVGGGASAKPSAEPAEVTLAVTRMWGPFSGHGSEGVNGAVWLKEGPAGAMPRSTLVGSAEGRRARIALEGDPQPEFRPPAALQAATVSVKSKPRAGSYSGALPLGDDGSLKLKLLVQDFLLWPVLTVLVGAVIGGLGTKAYAWRRRKRLLLSSLKDALELYADRRHAPHALGTAHDLTWPGPKDLPDKKACEQLTDPIVDAARQVKEVWCAVARVKGDEGLDSVAADVAAVRTTLDGWLEVDFEVQRLAAVSAELADHELRPYQDAKGLVREMANPPSDETTRQTHLLRVGQHANVVAAFVAAYAAWNVLDGRQWEKHAELDPRAIYGKFAGLPERSETDTAKMLRELASARDDLMRLEREGQEFQPQQSGRALSLPLLPSSTAAVLALTAALSKLGERRPLERLTAADLSARARRWDGLLQGAMAAVTVLAYVLTVYTGHTYGQSTDYLSAIAVGLLGQLGSFSINWDRFRGGEHTAPSPPKSYRS